MYLIELQQISIKNSRKSAESFYGGFSTEIRPKIGSERKFRNISKSHIFLELERS